MFYVEEWGYIEVSQSTRGVVVGEGEWPFTDHEWEELLISVSMLTSYTKREKNIARLIMEGGAKAIVTYFWRDRWIWE